MPYRDPPPPAPPVETKHDAIQALLRALRTEIRSSPRLAIYGPLLSDRRGPVILLGHIDYVRMDVLHSRLVYQGEVELAGEAWHGVVLGKDGAPLMRCDLRAGRWPPTPITTGPGAMIMIYVQLSVT